MAMAMASLGTACLSSKYLARPQASGKLNIGLRSVSAARPLASLSSSFMSGVSLAPRPSFGIVVSQRCRTLQVRAGKTCLGCTKRSRTRKAIARTSGFRVRLQTPSGRNILKRRRAKGRKILCPCSNPNSGKRA